MTSGLRLELTPLAERDFRGILRHTLREYDERQRDRYASMLTQAMDDLTQFPHLGNSRPDIPKGMRARVLGEHVIYYRVDSDVLTVIRILHQKMNAAKRLDR